MECSLWPTKFLTSASGSERSTRRSRIYHQSIFELTHSCICGNPAYDVEVSAIGGMVIPLLLMALAGYLVLGIRRTSTA